MSYKAIALHGLTNHLNVIWPSFSKPTRDPISEAWYKTLKGLFGEKLISFQNLHIRTKESFGQQYQSEPIGCTGDDIFREVNYSIHEACNLCIIDINPPRQDFAPSFLSNVTWDKKMMFLLNGFITHGTTGRVKFNQYVFGQDWTVLEVSLVKLTKWICLCLKEDLYSISKGWWYTSAYP